MIQLIISIVIKTENKKQMQKLIRVIGKLENLYDSTAAALAATAAIPKILFIPVVRVSVAYMNWVKVI